MLMLVSGTVVVAAVVDVVLHAVDAGSVGGTTIVTIEGAVVTIRAV